MPYAHKVLLENLLRNKDGVNVTDEQIEALLSFADNTKENNNYATEIQFTPARVILQDFTGVPCVVDLASMREAMRDLGGNEDLINPLKKVQLVIDHSLQIDYHATDDAKELNLKREFERNSERYKFLKWGQNALDNFECTPPGVGIIHQVNLEKLADVVGGDDEISFYDTCVGTDSHTTMINGIGVLGWGVGGIEAEAAMLGQSISMLIPEVIGFKLTGKPDDNVFATDIILRIVQMLREVGVVGKFVEFFGDAVAAIDVPTRATIANMCPEFGATCAIFGVDEKSLEYLHLTGRSEEHIRKVREYHEAQGTFGQIPDNTLYTQVIELDLSTVQPSISGPKRPQDRIALSHAASQFMSDLQSFDHNSDAAYAPISNPSKDDDSDRHLVNGDIVIASITSCTNTSNPEVLIAAGLVAAKAVELGIKPAKHVRTSFAPGSPAVNAYLKNSGLQEYLDQIGFNVVGNGCATCIGNSGPNPPQISQQVADNNLAVAAVLSGNRNFEGRINPDVKMNYLASPPLVIIYAIAGNMSVDINSDIIAYDKDAKPVYLRDLLPTHAEIQSIIKRYINPKLYQQSYADVINGTADWQQIPVSPSTLFDWDHKSTYIRKAPYFDNMPPSPECVGDIEGAQVLLQLGDSVTTDHISPAGNIKFDSPAGDYLRQNGIEMRDFNSYGSRRGNHEVMVRGTFANIRLNNLLLPKFTGQEKAGGYTVHFPSGGQFSVYDAAVKYQASHTPLIVFAGKEYGTGSSRDWAAKGTALLGVKAVIAESFERIHRSNLIGMGVLPLQFNASDSFRSLGLRGDEFFDIIGVDELNDHLIDTVTIIAKNPLNTDEVKAKFDVKLRIDTPTERDYYLHGGILQFVLRKLATSSAKGGVN